MQNPISILPLDQARNPRLDLEQTGMEQESQRQTGIEDLPTEIIEKILEMVARDEENEENEKMDPEEFFRMRRVCR